MSNDIGPGDWVEYIGKPEGYTSPKGSSPSSRYTIGGLYCVRETGRLCADGAGRPWRSMRLAGDPYYWPDGTPMSVPVAAFRPVYRPRADLIERLMQPVAGEEAAA